MVLGLRQKGHPFADDRQVNQSPHVVSHTADLGVVVILAENVSDDPGQSMFFPKSQVGISCSICFKLTDFCLASSWPAGKSSSSFLCIIGTKSKPAIFSPGRVVTIARSNSPLCSMSKSLPVTARFKLKSTRYSGLTCPVVLDHIGNEFMGHDFSHPD